MPILPTVRDPRLITIRRGGTLADTDHRLLAQWAIDCAEHVLPLFEEQVTDDLRPRTALNTARAWIRDDVPMKVAHQAAFAANAAGRGLPDPARFGALAAGQAVAVAAASDRPLDAGRAERDWQRERLPAAIRELVLDDQRQRNDICWGVFGE